MISSLVWQRLIRVSELMHRNRLSQSQKVFGGYRGAKSLGLPAPAPPRRETRVLKHFQERMPYGLFVPDLP
jgi:hypothetical protein